jgi:hypothetical protein
MPRTSDCTGLELYQAPGRCDLTADVNFSDLLRWGEEQGWQCLSQSTLTEFLSPSLPPSFHEAGQAFRVIEQGPA